MKGVEVSIIQLLSSHCMCLCMLVCLRTVQLTDLQHILLISQLQDSVACYQHYSFNPCLTCNKYIHCLATRTEIAAKQYEQFVLGLELSWGFKQEEALKSHICDHRPNILYLAMCGSVQKFTKNPHIGQSLIFLCIFCSTNVNISQHISILCVPIIYNIKCFCMTPHEQPPLKLSSVF